MSSDLPARPNLEHLKKEAKDRLRELRLQNPAAQLTDAQHAVARDYGFPSWPRLKAHIESLPAVPASEGPAPQLGGTFGRYTTKARQAVFFSRMEAAQFGSAEIEPEHVLLGLVRARHDLPSASLLPAEIRADLTARLTAGDPIGMATPVPFGGRARDALLHAAGEADRVKQEAIGTVHLLAGLLLSGDSVATQVLRDRGVTLRHIRERLVSLLDEERD